MSVLSWRPVRRDLELVTLDDLEAMRQILNECLGFMTKLIPVVTWESQVLWWDELPQKVVKYKAFVYFLDDNRQERVAFSLLQWHRDGRVTPLFGIRASARGHNIARQIIKHYLHEAEGPLCGEERVDHQAIIELNREAGWIFVGERDGVRFLYHPNEGCGEFPDYKGMLDYWGIA